MQIIKKIINSWRQLLFLATFLSMLFLLHAFVYLVIVRVYETTIPYWYVLLGVFSISFILASTLVRKFANKLVDIYYFAAASWLGSAFITFSVLVLYEIVRLIFSFDSKLVLGIFLLSSLFLSIFALYNGRRLVTREYIIPVKGLKKKTKVVHLSDVHIGTVHQTGYLKKIVEISNSLNPDFILMTGDLFDGSAPIHEEMLQPLDSLKAPAFFSIGNHEEYEGLRKVKETVQNLNMKLLDGEVEVFNDIQIVGVNDRQSLPKNVTLDSVLENLSLNVDEPIILMYHTPVEWESARKRGIDLMLSGHTHNGQIFPFTLLVRLSFKYINGLYNIEDKYLHVSPGTGTWGPPMRLGSRNQITLLTLVPNV